MTATEATTIGDIPELRERLAALETEGAGLEAAIDRAAAVGDEGEVLRLLVRGRILPHQRREALAAVLRAEIAEAGALRPGASVVVAAAREEAQRLHELRVAAAEAAREAERRWHSHGIVIERAENDAREIDQRLHALRERLAALSSPPPAPVAARRVEGTVIYPSNPDGAVALPESRPRVTELRIQKAIPDPEGKGFAHTLAPLPA